jgi:hypothetical protein
MYINNKYGTKMFLWQISITENNASYEHQLLGAFAKLRKETIRFVKPVCFSVFFSACISVSPSA